MSKRRNFLKTLVALPVVAKVATVSAEEPMETESDSMVYCCHCFELAGRGHSCEGYEAFKLENDS